MKRSFFGDPRPLGVDEISEAMAEVGIDPGSAVAILDETPDDDGFGNKGYAAELVDEDCSVSTLAYPTKVELLKDLEALGITNIE